MPLPVVDPLKATQVIAAIHIASSHQLPSYMLLYAHRPVPQCSLALVPTGPAFESSVALSIREQKGRPKANFTPNSRGVKIGLGLGDWLVAGIDETVEASLCRGKCRTIGLFAVASPCLFLLIPNSSLPTDHTSLVNRCDKHWSSVVSV